MSSIFIQIRVVEMMRIECIIISSESREMPIREMIEMLSEWESSLLRSSSSNLGSIIKKKKNLYLVEKS